MLMRNRFAISRNRADTAPSHTESGASVVASTWGWRKWWGTAAERRRETETRSRPRRFRNNERFSEPNYNDHLLHRGWEWSDPDGWVFGPAAARDVFIVRSLEAAHGRSRDSQLMVLAPVRAPLKLVVLRTVFAYLFLLVGDTQRIPTRNKRLSLLLFSYSVDKFDSSNSANFPRYICFVFVTNSFGSILSLCYFLYSSFVQVTQKISTLLGEIKIFSLLGYVVHILLSHDYTLLNGSLVWCENFCKDRLQMIFNHVAGI